jgi:hypothetical protein
VEQAVITCNIAYYIYPAIHIIPLYWRMSSLINDVRAASEFKTATFSEYRRVDVCKELIKCLRSGKVEAAVHWSAELVCSGHFGDVWECILTVIGKYTDNAKLPIYVEMRYLAFRDIVRRGHYVTELDLRNDLEIRAIFAETAGVLALSPKRHAIEHVKIDLEEGFDMTRLQEHLSAPNTLFGEPVFRKGDPKELYVAINELAFCVSSESRNTAKACYWIEWVMEFAAISKRHKNLCKCDRRDFARVDPKDQMDLIWMVWDVLIHTATFHSRLIQKSVDATMGIFGIRYTFASSKKRRALLYFAVGLLTTGDTRTPELVAEKDAPIVKSVLAQIDDIYADIKTNEASANMEYLFKSVDDARDNLDRSLQKMNVLNSMDLPAFFPPEAA